MNKFTILHINIRSAQKKLGSLANYLETLDHEFTIGIFEFCMKDVNIERYMLKSYNVVHKCRSLRSGGGVYIYIQDFLKYYTREDLCYQFSTIESVFIEIDKD